MSSILWVLNQVILTKNIFTCINGKPWALIARCGPPIVALLFLSFSGFPITAAAESSPPSFQVQGDLVYTARGFVLNRSFTMTVDGCLWVGSTRNVNTTDEPQNSTGYYETGYDGTNIYSLNVIDTNRLVQISQKPIDLSSRFVYGKGDVYPGPVPTEGTSHITPLWLAYASSCYYKSRNNLKVKPVWITFPDKSQRDLALDVKAIWKFNPENCFLDEAVYYSDGTTIGPMSKSINDRRPYSAPYNQGFMICSFKVSAYTNLNNFQYPQEFILSLHGPKPGGQSTNDLASLASWRGTTKTIKMLPPSEIDPLPKIPTRTMVQDRRLAGSFADRNDSSLEYVTQNQWPTTNDPMVTKSLEIKLAISKDDGKKVVTSHKNHGILLIILFTSIIPIIFFRKHLLRSKNN